MYLLCRETQCFFQCVRMLNTIYSHCGKENTIFVLDVIPLRSCLFCVLDGDDLLHYILCWQGICSVLADTHRLVQVGQLCGVTVYVTVLSTTTNTV